jgi:glucose/arabinose dehydrogenase
MQFRRHLGNRLTIILVLALMSLLLACSGTGGSSAPLASSFQVPRVVLITIASGFTNPIAVQQPLPDGSNRFFVAEQAGAIRIVQNGAILPAPFLDLTSKVNSGGEKGLLGLAFHPAYLQNRRFFVHYNRLVNSRLQSVVAEYAASVANPNQADPARERIILTLDQPFENHNGGQIAFGAGGFLYLGFGDGGSEGDPLGNGQNLQTLLGKILWIDVSSTALSYSIPPDNPLAAGGGRPEIWAYGLRNPWRFSFDLPTGRLFAGDVGQDRFEEIDLIQRGGNFGWSIMEAMHCFHPAVNCNTSGLIPPIAEYDHSEGDAVIGGYVYHGTAISGLQQAYVFGDFGSGRIWLLRENPPGIWTRSLLLATGANLSSFGQDQAGEIYVVLYSGALARLAPQ